MWEGKNKRECVIGLGLNIYDPASKKGIVATEKAFQSFLPEFILSAK